MIVFRKPLPNIDRPVMEADVVIVGGGPAGMACALRLSQLIDEHNAKHPDAQLSKENIYVLEKAREMGRVAVERSTLYKKLYGRKAPNGARPIATSPAPASDHHASGGSGCG